MNFFTKAINAALSALPEGAMEAARETIRERVLAGGELVSEEHFEARAKVCRTRLGGMPCEYFGPVFPGGVEFKEGCQACNCPLETKGRMKSITDPILAAALQKGVAKIICKHPKGNLWEQVDNEHQK